MESISSCTTTLKIINSLNSGHQTKNKIFSKFVSPEKIPHFYEDKWSGCRVETYLQYVLTRIRKGNVKKNSLPDYHLNNVGEVPARY